jgi:hypothetical protein
VDQKWRELLNVAAAEPSTADYSMEFKKTADGHRKGETRSISKRVLWLGLTWLLWTTRRRRPRQFQDQGREGPRSASF